MLTVALVGDSIAGGWFTPLQEIAEQRHWKLVTDLHAACPFTATMMVTVTGADYTSCHSWGVTALHDLETTVKPDVVITSDEPGLDTVAHPKGGAAAQADIRAGMSAYWSQLSRSGISVVAIKESPNMGINIPQCIAKHPASQSKCAIPVSKALNPDPPSVYAVKDAAGTVPLIDMTPVLCGPSSCLPVIGNVLVYQDNHHLTSAYTQTTAPYLEQQLLTASPALAQA